MVNLTHSNQEQVFAIDIGATNIKFCHVDHLGELRQGVRRRPTPYPCSPERLVEVLVERIAAAQCHQVGIGFPGEFRDGRVVRPGNLSRPGGVGTEIDPLLDHQWRGFELQEALRASTSRDVRVVNDATMAALGAREGVGTEVVLTLGTGLGLALVVNGQLRKVRDVGSEVLRDDRTYDQSLGERARAVDEDQWLELLAEVVENFADEFHATAVHLAGGNARRVTPTVFDHLSYEVVIHGNQAPLRGAARLFYA